MSGAQHTPTMWAGDRDSAYCRNCGYPWDMHLMPNSGCRAPVPTAAGGSMTPKAFDALLALAKQCASECAECHGSEMPMLSAEPESIAPDGTCAACADIRAVIAKAEPQS